MKAKVYYSTLWVYTFLEHIFVFCVMHKVFIVYCTLSRTEKSSVNKEDFRLKWDLMQQNPFFNSLKLKFNSIKFGSIRFEFFLCFCQLFVKIHLTLKLPGEGQMALPLNLNDKNIPNADFFLVF